MGCHATVPQAAGLGWHRAATLWRKTPDPVSRSLLIRARSSKNAFSARAFHQSELPATLRLKRARERLRWRLAELPPVLAGEPPGVKESPGPCDPHGRLAKLRAGESFADRVQSQGLQIGKPARNPLIDVMGRVAPFPSMGNHLEYGS